MSTVGDVVNAVVAERAAQDKRWGEQNHPDGTGYGIWVARAEEIKRRAAYQVKNNTLTWQTILYEEVAEAFAESDPIRLREELVQCAAVCVAWIEAIDRRNE